MSLFQGPGAAHGQALLLKLIGTDDKILAGFAGLRVLGRRGRHRHVTSIVLEVCELRRRYVLDVMAFGSLGLQLAADVVGHLAVLLALLRAALMLMVAFVPLIIHPGEDEHVQDQQAATDRDCHAQGGGISRETVLGLRRGVLESYVAGRGRRRVGRGFFYGSYLQGGRSRGCWQSLDESGWHLENKILSEFESNRIHLFNMSN